MTRALLLLFGLIMLGTSCSNKLKYFTEDMYYDYRWTDSELAQIQFYLSEDIILQKERSRESSRIKDGKIRIKEGVELEEIVIPKGTPGVFVKSPKGNQLAISFDDSDQQRVLMFGPNAKANGKYVLLAKKWKRNWGTITYGNQVYETSSASAYAALMVDIKKAEKLRVKRKTVKGNRVE